ncbi:hypothetical protein SK128_005565, partial [Halocaridina rubra]
TEVLHARHSTQKHSSKALSSDLVFSNQVEEALRFDKGDDALMTSWTTEDFTSKGDNYVSIITRVVVHYNRGEDKKEVTYVVKIKQMKQSGCASDFDNMVFNKEGKFYSKLLPMLNSELLSIKQEPLKMPRCLHPNWCEEQNHIFLEDLKPFKYILYDRRKSLDVQHTKLVLTELGRFHASSYLLHSKNPKWKVHQDFNFLKWEWFTYSEKTKKAIEVLVEGGLKTAAKLAKVAGYESVSKWYEEIAPDGVKILEEQIMRGSSHFNAISHGDCWISNMLFRYDDKENPIDMKILDLQFVRHSNLTLDLSYFFFTSLSRKERIEHISDLLSAYYGSFKLIADAASIVMPFTLKELDDEYCKASIFGLIMSTLLVPNILCDPEEVQDFDGGSDGQAVAYVERKRNRTLQMFQTNIVFKQRFTELFDDILDLVAFK